MLFLFLLTDYLCSHVVPSTVLIGDECSFEKECLVSIPHSNCSESTTSCFCEEGFMSDYNNTECVISKITIDYSSTDWYTMSLFDLTFF